MKKLPNVVIVGAARTPIGSFLGSLGEVSAPTLGAAAINAAIERAGIAKEIVDEVIMGNVLSAGVGQAPARQAALNAGLPDSIECMTINKVCGSGLKSVMLAAQAIMAGDAETVVAGGMESMSNVPFYQLKARNGYKMGHQKLIDGMIHDGLWDVYNDYHMGSAAELCARECNIPRDRQDDYARLSYRRALDAQQNGSFKGEIVPVPIPQKKGEPVIVDTDEEPGRVLFDKIGSLRPVFEKDGTVTAANASSINDGAAAVVVMSEEKARDLKLNPLVRIIGQASAAKKPEWFTTAPADAVEKVLRKTGMHKDDIDLYEINEAFAVVSLAVNDILGLPVEKVNVHGGAIALGHPIGASGARILVTLIYALLKYNQKTGLASLCIGGGEASSVIIENMR